MPCWHGAETSTTIIDSGVTFGGYIFADQLLIPEGTQRQIVVEVNFAGAPTASRWISFLPEWTSPFPRAFQPCTVRPSSRCRVRQRRCSGPTVRRHRKSSGTQRFSNARPGDFVQIKRTSQSGEVCSTAATHWMRFRRLAGFAPDSELSPYCSLPELHNAASSGSNR